MQQEAKKNSALCVPTWSPTVKQGTSLRQISRHGLSGGDGADLCLCLQGLWGRTLSPPKWSATLTSKGAPTRRPRPTSKSARMTRCRQAGRREAQHLWKTFFINVCVLFLDPPHLLPPPPPPPFRSSISPLRCCRWRLSHVIDILTRFVVIIVDIRKEFNVVVVIVSIASTLGN